MTTPPAKMGANFELQTKIRVIIQEVLSATIRKLSQFNQKIDKFEDYFIAFKERFEILQGSKEENKTEYSRMHDNQARIKAMIDSHIVKQNQDVEKAKLIENQFREQNKDFEKTLKQIFRQNETISTELSKTKSKFLEYSNIITGLKEEVAWKITKYLEETADSHSQMKVICENIKNQYFNVNLILDRQKEKYDQIILKEEQSKNQLQGIFQALATLQRQDTQMSERQNATKQHIDDIQDSLLGKIKSMESRVQTKVIQIEKNNSKLSSSLKKIDTFSYIITEIKREIENSKEIAVRLNSQSAKTQAQALGEEMLRVGKELLRMENAVQRKIQTAHEKISKSQEYFNERLGFLKMEMETEMSERTVKLMEDKSKTQNNLASSSLEEINAKISKIALETKQSVTKIEQAVREVASQSKKTAENIKKTIQKRIQSIPATQQANSRNRGNSSAIQISGEALSSMENAIAMMRNSIKQYEPRLATLESQTGKLATAEDNMNRRIGEQFTDLSEKMNSKIEKAMFLITKIRGDSIIRNEFNDREIKEMKKSFQEIKESLQTAWRFIPALGECTNLILSMIYDAEYQHSKIIQDNLPSLNKDNERFSTCVQGVLYEYKERKKTGTICYRRQEIKKTDLVRAMFAGYSQLWEQIYERELKTKLHMLPKGFYKSMIEKYINPTMLVPENKSAVRAGTEEQNFHIRRKKTASTKERDMVAVIQDDPAEAQS